MATASDFGRTATTFVAVAALVCLMALAPLITCSTCGGEAGIYETSAVHHKWVRDCWTCKGKGRVTLPRWVLEKNPSGFDTPCSGIWKGL